MLLLDQSPNAWPCRLIVPDSSIFTPSGDFTLECFGVKFTSTTGTQEMYGHYNSGSQRSFLVQWVSGTGWQLILSNDGGSNTILAWNQSASTGVEYNYCFERSGSTTRIYEGGTMQANGTKSGALKDTTSDVCVGHFNNAGVYNASPFLGTMKAIRLTVGVARYNTNGSYTVPTLPLPTS